MHSCGYTIHTDYHNNLVIRKQLITASLPFIYHQFGSGNTPSFILCCAAHNSRISSDITKQNFFLIEKADEKNQSELAQLHHGAIADDTTTRWCRRVVIPSRVISPWVVPSWMVPSWVISPHDCIIHDGIIVWCYHRGWLLSCGGHTRRYHPRRYHRG